MVEGQREGMGAGFQGGQQACHQRHRRAMGGQRHEHRATHRLDPVHRHREIAHRTAGSLSLSSTETHATGAGWSSAHWASSVVLP